MLRRFLNQAPLILGLLIVGAFYKPILNQKFWMLDDHNFVYWYTQSTDSKLQNFFQFLKETNFGEYPSGLRFTPTLNVLFAGRTVILPNDPSYWFIANFTLVLLTYVFTYAAIKFYLNKKDSMEIDVTSFIAALIGALSLCNTVGARVFTRLGTGEAYAFLFLFSSFYYLQKVLSDPYKKRYWVYLFLLNGLLIGCKENYIWINILVSTVVLYRFKNEGQGLRLAKIAYVSFSTLLFLFVLYGFLPAALSVKNDIYGRGTSPTHVLESLISLFSQNYFLFVLTCSILLIVIGRDCKSKLSINLLLIISILFLVIDQVYYRGSINDHYLANRVIAIVFLITAALKLFSEKTSIRPLAIPLMTTMLVVLVCFNYSKGAERVTSHVRATTDFSNSLDKIYQSRMEFTQFAFVAQSSWDYESMFSVAKQLRARGDTREFYLFASKIPKANQDSITDIFQNWMEDGVGRNLYKSIRSHDSDSGTICAYSQIQNIKVDECDQIILITWLP